MIIYGWGDKTIKEYNDSTIQCKQCGGYSHAFVVFQKYFHIFWIPFFPIGRKKIGCLCSNCGDESNTDRLEYYLSMTRTPLWLFSGLLIIMAIWGYHVAGNQITRINNNSYMKNPRVGDILQVATDYQNKTVYHFWKIADMDQDTLFIYQNNYYYPKKNTKELDEEDYFIDNDIYYILKEALFEMKEVGELVKVIRKYPASSTFNREVSVEIEEDEEDVEEV